LFFATADELAIH